MPKLSQVFLVDERIILKIVEEAGVEPDEYILEVGPGKGHLTRVLLERDAKVVAVELDYRLYKELERTYALLIGERLFLKWGDFLKIKVKDLLKEFKLETHLKFLSNIPYAITTPILEKLIREREYFKDIYMTVQKEVGERLTAEPDSDQYGALSIFVQYHFEPEILFTIGRRAFSPVPKVNSVFVRLKPRKVPPVNVDEKLFFKIVRSSFQMRRKKLSTVLRRLFRDVPLKEVEELSGVSLERRGETLNIEEFARLSNSILKFIKH